MGKLEKSLAAEHCSPDTMGDINLTCAAFLRLTKTLAGRIPNKYQTWLMIGGNGFRVGAALYGRAGQNIIKRVNLAYMRARHYKGRHKQSRVLLSPVVGKLEKPILIIDDIIDSGDTARAVRKKIKNAKADIAVLFKKPWSKIKPDYCLQETDKWIVFPWE
ncbi:MAG: phosphoribosyltransferase family protein [Kiritimatiellia bacterium]|nr:phosphoribosyltransferase family protein [Kiritimatiellia bacterium]